MRVSGTGSFVTVIDAFVSVVFFLFKQNTAYEMRISDWSSDVCSSDLFHRRIAAATNNQQYLRFLEFLGPYLIPRLKVPRSLGAPEAQQTYQLGRASCRERVCQYV